MCCRSDEQTRQEARKDFALDWYTAAAQAIRTYPEGEPVMRPCADVMRWLQPAVNHSNEDLDLAFWLSSGLGGFLQRLWVDFVAGGLDRFPMGVGRSIAELRRLRDFWPPAISKPSWVRAIAQDGVLDGGF